MPHPSTFCVFFSWGGAIHGHDVSCIAPLFNRQKSVIIHAHCAGKFMAEGDLSASIDLQQD